MMRLALLLAVLSPFLLHIACTPAPPMQEDQRRDLAEVEADFDPLAQDRDKPIVIEKQEKNSTEQGVIQEDQEEPELQEVPLGPGWAEVTQGYRVQLFLSDDLREAARVLAEARVKFDEEEVYLEYDAPYYKVRVGDCQTELEGQRLLKIAQRLGYQDAWLVRTAISVAEEPNP